jgi:hypothetical protein
MGIFNGFRKKKAETLRENTPEIPAVVDVNALQDRIATALRALILLDDSATPIDYQDYTKVRQALNRLSDEAKELGSEVVRLIGNRELAILSEGKASFSGTTTPKAPYPLMGILPNAMRKECGACMLWVPGRKHFLRVVACHREGVRNDPAFGGNVFLFNEALLRRLDLRCCLVDGSERVALLPDDWLTNFISYLEANVLPEYRVPLISGDPLDFDSWKWAGQAQGQKLIILGSMI